MSFRNSFQRLCALLALFVMLLGFTGAAWCKTRPLVIAHRGANAHAPENTLPAFEKAIELGADGVENDIFLTKDGVVVVSHDETIDRCSNGTGRIDEMTLAQLREYDFGSWFSPAFAGTKIPTLDEFLDVAWGMLLLIELKTNDRDIALQAVAAVKARGLMDRTVFQSFDMDAIQACRAADPGANIALLYGAGCDYDRQARADPAAFCAEYGLGALHPYHTAVTAKLARACDKAGVGLRAWTVNEWKPMSAVTGQGVRGIITDQPELCRKILRLPWIVHWVLGIASGIRNR